MMLAGCLPSYGSARRLARLWSLVLGVFVSLCLHGCESEYERALRMSCDWNEDIKLVGCDRIDFAECISNCEYCLGKEGTALEGRSDECSQLKCGAYCAESQGTDCLDTYKILCNNAVEEIAAAYNASLGGIQHCDVNCNSASKKAPGFLFILTLATSMSPFKIPLFRIRHIILVVAAVVVASTLQGCADFCVEKSTPSLSWKLDFHQLDWDAGCHNDWNLMTGNPCASDVPVMWAKKGVAPQDEDYIIENVENEVYECLDWHEDANGNNLFCLRWIAKESGCDEEDFGICKCLDDPITTNYCQTWTCFMKEANQHECWTSCCGDESCTPCITCGQHGSSPFHMDYDVFIDLLSGSGAGTIFSLGEQEATTLLRNTHYGHFMYNGQCITNRHIKEVGQAPPCGSWREIETEMGFCTCNAPDSTGDYCLRWTCEEKDVGQFAILFAKPMSYEGLIEGSEIEKYDCLEYSAAPSSVGGLRRCAKWKGDINSYEEVETTQCIFCGNGAILGNGNGECNSWICNEYEMPRIHDVDDWPKRLFFSWVHFLWIIPITLVLCTPPQIEGGGSVLSLYICGSFCGTVLVAFTIWAIAFLRYKADEARWVAPSDPFLGLLLPLSLGVPLAFTTSIFTKVPVPTGVFQVPIILLCGWWNCVGLYWGAPVSLIVAVGLGVAVCGIHKQQD